ncbi:hypothetical protein PCC7424_2548 [Gloeothece citriformis PCC 7424]|uniref:Isopropylmalate/homocitrate/citramalate synthase n=1 Tax=Gloeothece citriformis (strain PCC 7424) TaxID=65393 RepID=B7KK79_GLOC7|nr:hypothetical protein [Gloeothece citriformis]ACK70964.1 hypothetical protein PCC7424_2548 [Gloeothece citriformis PCC 7424]
MKKSDQNPKINSNSIDKTLFLYPLKSYRGEFSPKNLIFNANLQEFAQRVSFMVGLHTNGKLSSEETYAKIAQLWLELKHSQESTEIDSME